MKCSPPPTGRFVLSGYLTGAVICGNTPNGEDIIKKRKAYCTDKGVADKNCIYGIWKAGKPTMAGLIEPSSSVTTLNLKIGQHSLTEY